MQRKKSVLVVQTAFLGDLLLTIPLFRKLKQMNEGQSIVLVCRKELGDLLLKLKVVDEVFEVQKNHRNTYKEALSSLKSKFEFSEIYVPHQSFRSTLFLSQLSSPKKVGYKSWWNFIFYDFTLVRNWNLPEPLRLLQMATVGDEDLKKNILDYESKWSKGSLGPIPGWAQMGCKSEIQKWTFSEDIQKDHRIQEILKNHEHKPGSLICVFPGSVWPTKKWTESGFVELCQKLIKDGYQIALMGGADEKELCLKIQESVPESLLLAGLTNLTDTLKVLSLASLVISNDSGGQHLASVAETATVTIFGPTVLDFGFRPWLTQSAVVQNSDLKCRPCGIHGHKKCPLGTHECMTSVTAISVYDQAQKLLIRARPSL